MSSKISQFPEPSLCNSSKLRKTSFIHHWTVENFADFKDRKYEIPSQKFIPDVKDGTEWRLVLFTKHIYPKGPCLAASLVKLSDDGNPHGIKYSISLISDYSVHHFRQCREKTFTYFLDSDECVIVSHAELVQKMHFSQRKPDLFIRCEIDMLIVENTIDCCVSSKQPTLATNDFTSRPAVDINVKSKSKNTISNSSAFKKESLQNHYLETSHILDSLNCLSEDFHSLYQKKDLTDITLVCEGVSIRAHKAVLAARSEVFRSANIEDQISISGIKCVVVEAILYYMYTGKTRQLTADMAMDMLYAAEKFKLDQLRNLLLDFLKANATTTNVKNMPQLSEKLEAKDMKKLVELNFFN